jgi:hypothetical protein
VPLRGTQTATNVMPCGMHVPNDAVLQEFQIHVLEQFLGFDSRLYYNALWSGFSI